MKFSIFILCLVLSFQVVGQTPYLPPVQPTSTPVSYVRTWTAIAPLQNADTLIVRSLKDVQQATAYFDGLGRPLQTVVKQGSLKTDPGSPASANNAVDMVSPFVY
ncbi:MAG TPA: hypothetical protein VEB40_01835, partial [Flavipsychrobacter sp.]|nr:hypothetical protein [Flavipsychrobacter sp.]